MKKMFDLFFKFNLESFASRSISMGTLHIVLMIFTLLGFSLGAAAYREAERLPPMQTTQDLITLIVVGGGLLAGLNLLAMMFTFIFERDRDLDEHPD